jgi:hypothetical protein
MKKYNIRSGGKPLGRPGKQTTENAEQLKQEKLQRRQDGLDRIPIEGKFGQGENGYRLNYIRVRTLKTSEAWINSIFLVMNLMVLFRFCWVQFTCVVKEVQKDVFANLPAEALSIFIISGYARASDSYGE